MKMKWLIAGGVVLVAAGTGGALWSGAIPMPGGKAQAKSGEILGKARAGGNYAASPVCAEGRVYCFSREGKTVVFRADRELAVLAENQLDGPVFGSPAFANSTIYLRTDSHLYCLSSETPQAPE